MCRQRRLQKLWLVGFISRHRIQTVRSTRSCSSTMRLTANVGLTFNLTPQSSQYSEHRDFRLQLVAVKPKGDFCGNTPSKKYAAFSAPRKTKQNKTHLKKQLWLKESMIHAQNLTGCRTGVGHYGALTCVDSHGGKGAAASPGNGPLTENPRRIKESIRPLRCEQKRQIYLFKTATLNWLNQCKSPSV